MASVTEKRRVLITLVHSQWDDVPGPSHHALPWHLVVQFLVAICDTVFLGCCMSLKARLLAAFLFLHAHLLSVLDVSWSDLHACRLPSYSRLQTCVTFAEFLAGDLRRKSMIDLIDQITQKEFRKGHASSNASAIDCTTILGVSAVVYSLWN